MGQETGIYVEWDENGKISKRSIFMQENLSAYLYDAEELGWERLDLRHTRIQELPESIGQLSNLQTLDLYYTNIEKLPKSIGHLLNLRHLDVSCTKIQELPDTIGQLSNLQTLHLSASSIYKLPESIGQLKNLKTLDLQYCNLKEIPYSVVQLGLPFVIDNVYATGCVNLHGTTLDEGDISLFSQSRNVIEEYYKQGKTLNIRECKVIFLGDGGVGKSSLIERVINDSFQKGALPTDGLKITKWETTLNERPFTLRFLDFGGQEIMHSMHRCFLTAHTVYVVVCGSRDDAEIERSAARWLETVKAFAPGCPVILALNKSDENPNVSVNERDLKARNGALKCVLKTSAADGSGVDRLMEAVMEEIPGCINNIKGGADLLGVKLELENLKQDYITSEQYREICASHHIEKPKTQYDMLNYFKDLGVAYFYESEDLNTRLESVRVLNPAWLTNGIYRLILRTKESGFLSHKEIKKTLRGTYPGDILREKTYTPEETEFILYVMRMFEISHAIGGGVEMIPMKLPKTPPETVNEFDRENTLHLRWEGNYLPNNLIHRLLIRKYPELDTNCVWRTGGRFRQTDGTCAALAEMNDKALDVYVSGARDCRAYLDTFRGVIQKILTDLNLHSSVTEWICCKTDDGQEGKIPYRDVMQLYYDRISKALIPGTSTYYNPAELLRDTYPDWQAEAENFRMSAARDRVPPPEKPETPEKTEKTPLEIELQKAKIDNTRADTTSKRLRNWGFVAVCAVVVILLISNNADKIRELLELVLPFLGGG